MALTDRQKQILNSTILEYIRMAEPISSQLLEEKYSFSVSPATIRNELGLLTEKGYLVQPHISSGRIPTDKGYRFFVDTLFQEKKRRQERLLEIEQDMQDYIEFLQTVLKHVASISSNLACAYLADQHISWKEGWERILHEPEFIHQSSIKNLTKFVEDFEEKRVRTQPGEVTIYIGKENPFSKIQDFSIIFTEHIFDGERKGIVAIIGPKRMAYEKNIDVMNSLQHMAV